MVAWWLRKGACTAEGGVRILVGAKCLLPFYHEISVNKQRDGRVMRLCADNCVAGLLVSKKSNFLIISLGCLNCWRVVGGGARQKVLFRAS